MLKRKSLRTTLMLEDPKINIRLRLAALWTVATLCYLYGDYFELYTPGKVQSLLSGENVLENPVILLIASVIMVIPPLMIFLSLVMKPKACRMLNIVTGILFTVLMTLIAIGSLTPWYAFYVFLAIVEALLTLMVVITAWKWPRTEIPAG